VLSESLNKGFWLLGDLSPLLNRGDVVTDVMAWLKIELEVEEELLKVFESGNDLEVFQFTDEALSVLNKLVTALHAGLEFSQVVIANHAVEETGGEIRDGQDIEAKFLLSREWHKKLNCCSGVLSSVEVFVS